MFKLDGDAKRLLDDPYADLIKGNREEHKRKAPADADAAVGAGASKSRT